MAQKEGRDVLFKSYRIRIAGVIRDYGTLDQNQTPQDSRAAL